MRVPISWLREFVALPPDAQAIADRLAMLGFPVAEIERRPTITGVVTARIAALEKHPNADRLQVAQVDVGADAPLTIATAATNVAAGQTIAVATIGAQLPALTIAPRTMRGVASQGMMISAEELALPGEWFEDGIMQLEPDCDLGLDVVDLFGLDTAVLDVEITTNRPDAMSIVGLARELAASYGSALRLPDFVNPGRAADPPGEEPKVLIESDDCYRFVSQRIDDVRVAPAPAWMRVRLALSGQRPINNLVDVSNYVMLETGQPLHFYDARAIHGGRLIVRRARDGESIVTLDGVTRTLSPQALVIADDERPLCLAGLMGGAASEVAPETTAIVLEAANFNGVRVRRMSNALALRTEASSRHEKSLPPALTDLGAARAAALLHALGATVYQPHAYGGPVTRPPAIALKVADVARLLGLPLAAQTIEHHLVALGCEVERVEPETWAVTPPAWRCDLAIAADLIEEVARVEGYERIPVVVPSVAAHEISSAAFTLESRISQALKGLGYREIITQSLRGAGSVEVRNPLSEEQRFLRDSLAPGIIEYLAENASPIRVFEIGEVFDSGGNGVVERSLLTFGFSADPLEEPPWRDSDFLALKGDCEQLLRGITGRDAEMKRATHPGFHPGKTALATLDEREVAHLGRVDPRTAKASDLRRPAYLCVVDIASLPVYETPRYRVPSRYPSTYRDVALVVDIGVSARDIERAIGAAVGSLCTGATVFDEYRGPQIGEGRKSLAARVTLQRFDATITDEEADAAVALLLGALQKEFGAEIRT
ncbi:MAG TPA: phenylalanine--tRNA ligase subunit beta [Candidatus Cybelea sp.]|nr:phenylalanine--tRNA ligase subunit beta [Candidatus Cybelea sp.]